MKLQITIEGKVYAVDVEVLEDEDSRPEPEVSFQHNSTASAQNQEGAWDRAARICRSPVMGIAIKVNVKPGQSVESGELLMVLEAMKMETNITAPRAATVKNICVAPGNAVKLDQVLLELE